MIDKELLNKSALDKFNNFIQQGKNCKLFDIWLRQIDTITVELRARYTDVNGIHHYHLTTIKDSVFIAVES